MNRRGFTLIEMMITITLTIGIVYSVIIIPTQLMRQYREYSVLVDESNDMINLRSALVSDLRSNEIEIIDNENIVIGDSTYTFSDGLKRNMIVLSESDFSFDVSDSLLIIKGDKIELKFSTMGLNVKESDEN